MPFRYSMLMQVTTQPVSVADAINHVGGWSEGFWNGSELPLDGSVLDSITTARAALLPKQAAVLGIRRQKYDIQDNRLIPRGASTYAIRKPGSPTLNVNIPQDAMMWSAATGSSPTGARFKTKCLPDEVVEQGEFNGNSTYKAKMTIYANALIAGGMGSLVRGTGGVIARVLDITAGVLTADTTLLAVQNEFVRFKRVYDKNTNLPIRGSFRVTSVTALLYTLAGLPTGAAAVNSGTAVLDSIGMASWTAIKFQRVVSGKVGGPFERYRGRQSKQRA